MSFCLPYDCGITLPLEQRYTDWRFRRVCRYIHGLDQADAIELAATLRLLPVKWAHYAFHGKAAWRRDATEVLNTFWDACEPYYRTNLERITPETTVLIVQALREGGWKCKNPLPPVVRMGCLGFRARGKTTAQIAEIYGFSYWTVAWQFRSQPSAAREVGLVL
jgi:hypothetical protein